jgi:hypothetical protein
MHMGLVKKPEGDTTCVASLVIQTFSHKREKAMKSTVISVWFK